MADGYDLAPVFLERIQQEGLKVKSAMSPGVTTVDEQTLGRDIAKLMYAKNIKRVQVQRDGKLIGMTALFTAWRDLIPQFGDEPEMGWIFATETHGHGLAVEACMAVLNWAEANLHPTPIWAIIAPANEPSLKLAGKLGFEPLQETPYHGEPTLVLRRPAWSRS